MSRNGRVSGQSVLEVSGAGKALMSRIVRVSGRRLLDFSRPRGEISIRRDKSKGWTCSLNFSDETTYLGSEGSGSVTVVVSRNGRVSGQGLRECAGPTAKTSAVTVVVSRNGRVGETTPKGGPSAPPSQSQPSAVVMWWKPHCWIGVSQHFKNLYSRSIPLRSVLCYYLEMLRLLPP